MAEKGEKERALVRERVIYALIMQQPRFITSDTRCLADSGIARSIDRSKDFSTDDEGAESND